MTGPSRPRAHFSPPGWSGTAQALSFSGHGEFGSPRFASLIPDADATPPIAALGAGYGPAIQLAIPDDGSIGREVELFDWPMWTFPRSWPAWLAEE
ncbi:MAG: hypothetical protein L3K14_09940 [Thermoplasmata archaeon]|nr:hypothetical protein [Thermoplasmata archaeon]